MPVQQTRRALAPTSIQDERVERRYAQRRRFGESSRRTSQQGGIEDKIATALGWFSIGLGLSEILAPKGLAKLIGLDEEHPLLFRVLGLREIASGVGILSRQRPAGWVWSRVAGDAIDLSLLGFAMASDDSDRTRLIAATAAVAGVTALDVYNAQQLSVDSGPQGGLIAISAVTINRSPDEVYRFWRDLQNLPRFMKHLAEVRVLDDRRSHWVARAPAGKSVEWDAEITEDKPGELISWRSIGDSDVDNFGSVHFERAPGDRGTEVCVEVEYNPPAGVLGAGIAKIFGEAPDQQIKNDLSRLKQVLETGEVVQSDASIHSGMHPAQPPMRW